jgi:hypothetical protein
MVRNYSSVVSYLLLVIILNFIILAALTTFLADPTNLFTITLDAFQQDITINTTGGYATLYYIISRFL